MAVVAGHAEMVALLKESNPAWTGEKGKPGAGVRTQRRPILGGPWHGRSITVPYDLELLECGRLTGAYHYSKGAFRYRSIVNAPRWEAPCPLEN